MYCATHQHLHKQPNQLYSYTTQHIHQPIRPTQAITAPSSPYASRASISSPRKLVKRKRNFAFGVEKPQSLLSTLRSPREPVRTTGTVVFSKEKLVTSPRPRSRYSVCQRPATSTVFSKVAPKLQLQSPQQEFEPPRHLLSLKRKSTPVCNRTSAK